MDVSSYQLSQRCSQGGVIIQVSEKDKPQFELIFFDIPAMYLLDGYIDLLTYTCKSVKFNDEMASEWVV